MKRVNCYFRNLNYGIKTSLIGFIHNDDFGYFIDFAVYHSDVIPLMKLGITPKWSVDRNKFYLRSALTNSTSIRLNGVKIGYFQNASLNDISAKDIKLDKLLVSKYASEHNGRQCYTNNLLLLIPQSKLR